MAISESKRKARIIGGMKIITAIAPYLLVWALIFTIAGFVSEIREDVIALNNEVQKVNNEVKQVNDDFNTFFSPMTSLVIGIVNTVDAIDLFGLKTKVNELMLNLNPLSDLTAIGDNISNSVNNIKIAWDSAGTRVMIIAKLTFVFLMISYTFNTVIRINQGWRMIKGS